MYPETKIVGTVKICSIEGCGKTAYAKGWCSMHHARWKRHGDVNYYHYSTSLKEYFEAKLLKGDWCWTLKDLTPTVHGYVHIYFKGKTLRGHRVSYELYVGDIPEGMVVDHKYNTLGCPRHCVNPEHLQVVTPKQNAENVLLRVDSTTKVRGVTKRAGWNKYRARVGHKGKRIHLGDFDTLEEAEYAVDKARKELHTNYNGGW